MTAGQDATSNAIALDVASRRRICLAFPHPAAHGLLSLISLLRAFLLNAIKRNQGELPSWRKKKAQYTAVAFQFSGGWRVRLHASGATLGRRLGIKKVADIFTDLDMGPHGHIWIDLTGHAPPLRRNILQVISTTDD